jgi:hypothetical protein
MQEVIDRICVLGEGRECSVDRGGTTILTEGNKVGTVVWPTRFDGVDR